MPAIESHSCDQCEVGVTRRSRRWWLKLGVTGVVVGGIQKNWTQGLAADGRDVVRNGVAEELKTTGPLKDWRFIVLHHSATMSGSVAQLDEEHRQRRDANGQNWLGIAYHFVIGNGIGMDDGAVESTFRWREQLHGAHSGDVQVNAAGIGICLIGNFDESPPTERQWATVRRLVRALSEQHRVGRDNVFGHASVRKTRCPGRFFPLEDLRKVVPAS